MSSVSAFDPREATIACVHEAIFSRTSSVKEVVQSFLSRIEALNASVNAIISLDLTALDVADELDAALADGKAGGALFGVPILLKDNYDLAGLPTTAACLSLADCRPSRDAPAVVAFKKAGAVILGKTNLHEFALEGLSVSSLGGQTVNPYDLTRTPGGSSGGSAAAVAMSFCVFATGTDTVNSLRNPASANSLYSVRPTRGLISRSGIIPVSDTQDVVGPITRSVQDLAIALTVMASAEADSDSIGEWKSAPAKDFTQGLTSGSLAGLRFGILEGFLSPADNDEVNPVNGVMQSMVDKIEAAGAATMSITDSMYDAPAILARYDTQRFEFRKMLNGYLERSDLMGNRPKSFKEVYDGKEFLIIPAQYEYIRTAAMSSTSDVKYQEITAGIDYLTASLRKTFVENQLDAVIYPQQKSLVVKVGSASQSQRNGILAALTGSPVVTIPAGFSVPTPASSTGVPIGVELLGPPSSEHKLLQVAYELEKIEHVRREPDTGKLIVETQSLQAVPRVVPNISSISPQYPGGIL